MLQDGRICVRQTLRKQIDHVILIYVQCAVNYFNKYQIWKNMWQLIMQFFEVHFEKWKLMLQMWQHIE